MMVLNMHKILFHFLIFSLMPVQNYAMWQGWFVRAQQGFEALLESDYESEDLGVVPIETCSAVAQKQYVNVDDKNVEAEDINVGSIAAICAAMAAVGVIKHHTQRDNPGVQRQRSMTQKIASCEDVLDGDELRAAEFIQQKNNFFNDSGYGNFFQQRLTPDDSPNSDTLEDGVIFAQVSSSRFNKVQSPNQTCDERPIQKISASESLEQLLNSSLSTTTGTRCGSLFPMVAQERRNSPLPGWVEISEQSS